ncbi:MAG: 50S ribosomal protein L19 [Bacteroidota bacterium]
MNLLQYAEDQLIATKEIPTFKTGDTVTVHYKIKEGEKERVQQFMGIVIQKKGKGKVKTFTVRKISNGVGVERIFPLFSTYIAKIVVNKMGDVRRAKLYYLRHAIGKKAKIDELKKDEVSTINVLQIPVAKPDLVEDEKS